jgi:hypothetical protein
MRSKRGALIGMLLAGALCSAKAHAVLNLVGENYGTYGDANSYSLPSSAFKYDFLYGGGTGPGNPFFVDSSPGSIKDTIVIATGSSGVDETTNFAGMDTAMATPNGGSGSNFFSGVWHSTVSALLTYLNGYAPIFLFNNNQVNSGASTNQNLAAWAQITLTGTGLPTLYFDLTNQGEPYALITEGGGGTVNGDPSLYTSTGAGPLAGNNTATDYVFSGGELCLNGLFAGVSCSSPHLYGPINHNLGANQAAYAIDVPELDLILAAGGMGYTDFYMDLRLGCDPAAGVEGSANCIGRDLNNGYEQVFVLPGLANPIPVPEPGSLALVLAGMMLVARKRRDPSNVV